MQLPMSIPELLKLAFEAGWESAREYRDGSWMVKEDRDASFNDFLFTLGLDLN